jgi:methyl-accepting chemotaxis protein
MSFTAVFTTLSLVIVFFIAVSISSIFYYNIRNIIHRQIVANTGETMKLLQSEILATLKDYTNLIEYTNSGVLSLFRLNNDVPRNIMQDYLRTNKNIVPGVEWVYFSNNIKWNEPGGYFALNEEWIPEDDYDQTQRPWFTVAKEAGREVAFLEPFIDATLGSLNIAMSMTAFDMENKDIGVVSLEIVVDSLVSLVQGDDSRDIWLLDKDGLFITHSDTNAVMTKNFFTEMGLERYRTQALSKNENFLIEDKDILLYIAPISEAGWFLVSHVSRNEIFAEANWLITITGLILAMLLIVSAAILIIFTKRT